jgi:hypothetical protein
MKKLITIIVSLLIPILSFSQMNQKQTIMSDANYKTYRSTSTSLLYLSEPKGMNRPIWMNLSYNKDEDGDVWTLCLELYNADDNFSIPVGAILVFDLVDGNSISLMNSFDITDKSMPTPNEKSFRMPGYYDIDYNDIIKLGSATIKDLIVETSLGTSKLVVTKDQITPFLSLQFMTMVNYLKEHPSLCK